MVSLLLLVWFVNMTDDLPRIILAYDGCMESRSVFISGIISIASSHCCNHFQKVVRCLPGYNLPLHISSETLLISARVYTPQAFLLNTLRDIYILMQPTPGWRS